MEGPMKKAELPNTDSIRKLAEFWDTHDLTDFEGELDEVAEPVFVRDPRASGGGEISVPLDRREAEAVERLARAKGVSREQLVRAWVLQKIARPGPARRRGAARRP